MYATSDIYTSSLHTKYRTNPGSEQWAVMTLSCHTASTVQHTRLPRRKSSVGSHKSRCFGSIALSRQQCTCKCILQTNSSNHRGVYFHLHVYNNCTVLSTGCRVVYTDVCESCLQQDEVGEGGMLPDLQVVLQARDIRYCIVCGSGGEMDRSWGGREEGRGEVRVGYMEREVVRRCAAVSHAPYNSSPAHFSFLRYLGTEYTSQPCTKCPLLSSAPSRRSRSSVWCGYSQSVPLSLAFPS